jgi:FAD/FMN-containing dehydrogenase
VRLRRDHGPGVDVGARSTQPNSVSIWVHHLQTRVFHASPFRPAGCSSSINTAAVTAGGGTQMKKLAEFAHRFGHDVVVGNSDTVSVGGFVSGGGHGVLSALHGLAADSVLQAEVVTPTGDVVTANECQNTDLFWAVRGVGPPSPPSTLLTGGRAAAAPLAS